MKHESSACPTRTISIGFAKGVVIDGHKTGPADVKTLGPGICASPCAKGGTARCGRCATRSAIP